MAQSVNLIPREERLEQSRKRLIKVSSLVAVFLALAVSGLSVFVGLRNNKLRTQIQEVDTQIAKSRQDIKNLKDLEINARVLDTQYKLLTQFFATRKNYSYLLVELKKRVPAPVAIGSVSLSGDAKDQLNLTGTAQDYLPIATLLATLTNRDFLLAEDKLKQLFISAAIRTVSYNADKSNVEYFIVADFAPGLLN